MNVEKSVINDNMELYNLDIVVSWVPKAITQPGMHLVTAMELQKSIYFRGHAYWILYNSNFQYVDMPYATLLNWPGNWWDFK